MAHVAGKDFILKIYDGTSTYNTIGSCRETSSVLTYDPVDTSSKSSQFKTSLDGAGKIGRTIDITGVAHMNGDDTGYESLKALADSATQSQELFELLLGDGEKITGTLELLSFTESGSDGAESTFSASFQTSGTLTRASA